MSLIAAGARRRGTEAPPPAQYPTSAPYNVPDHLFIPTYDGSNQPVHFDVIDFPASIGSAWNGWRLWMAMTPWPYSIDTFEDPSILVSQDGLTWLVPPGLTNPLYLPTGPYNNDTDIAYDPDTDEMVLIYRDFQTLMLARSSDGITWPTTPLSVFGGANTNPSPTLVREPSGVWHLWTKDDHRTAPAPEGPWTLAPGPSGLISVWHLNVALAPGGGFHMLYHSGQAGPSGEVQFFAASSADGSAWVNNTTPVLVSGTHAWSAAAMYRAALSLHAEGDRYRVWYPGRDASGVWRGGYTEIPLAEWPAIP